MPVMKNVTMASITSAAANAAINVSVAETVNVWVTGTFVGTVKLQVSPDGTNWVDDGSPVTAPAKITATSGASYVRLNCTAYTSGTIVGIVSVIDEDRLG